MEKMYAVELTGLAVGMYLTESRKYRYAGEDRKKLIKHGYVVSISHGEKNDPNNVRVRFKESKYATWDYVERLKLNTEVVLSDSEPR